MSSFFISNDVGYHCVLAAPISIFVKQLLSFHPFNWIVFSLLICSSENASHQSILQGFKKSIYNQPNIVSLYSKLRIVFNTLLIIEIVTTNLFSSMVPDLPLLQIGIPVLMMVRQVFWERACFPSFIPLTLPCLLSPPSFTSFFHSHSFFFPTTVYIM